MRWPDPIVLVALLACLLAQLRNRRHQERAVALGARVRELEAAICAWRKSPLEPQPANNVSDVQTFAGADGIWRKPEGATRVRIIMTNTSRTALDIAYWASDLPDSVLVSPQQGTFSTYARVYGVPANIVALTEIGGESGEPS
jgi:hypothetical protein